MINNSIFSALKGLLSDIKQNIPVGTIDLKIAAIALSVKGIVVTHNQRDFEKVPGLIYEDWTTY